MLMHGGPTLPQDRPETLLTRKAVAVWRSLSPKRMHVSTPSSPARKTTGRSFDYEQLGEKVGHDARTARKVVTGKTTPAVHTLAAYFRCRTGE